MAVQARPHAPALGSPVQDKSNDDSHYLDTSTQSYDPFDNAIPEQFDITQTHPRNHNAALTAALNQLDNFIAARNICRCFMLSICTSETCTYVHDAIFRDTFMGTLFGNAWREFWSLPQQISVTRYPPKGDTDRVIQADQAIETHQDTITGDKYNSDLISFEPPSNLNVAARLYIPPWPPTARVHAGVSTEMDLEKSEVQVASGSEDVLHPYPVADSSSPLRPRRGQRLYGVRDRISLWSKSAWRKSLTTKQRKSHNESEVALEKAG
jgi:hypothetical protein